ncbi:MAG: glycosyltransferase [Opitutae bacterium]|nr:glycosyltransferase [Opitutae bacterium]
MPTVSVIVPFHRATPFLPIAAQSVLDQSFGDWELVAVDNGTGAGCDALGPAGRDDRVRVVSLPRNFGAAVARNAGVAAARGEFIALLDYDDVAWTHRFTRQVAALRADPTLDLVGSHADTIDQTGRRVGWQFTLTSPSAQKTFSRYSMPATAPSYTGRRAVFERHPYRPEFELAEDFDFLARVTEHGHVAALPEPLLSYRVHSGQGTQQFEAKQSLHAALVRVAGARRRLKRPEQLAESREVLRSLFEAPPSPAEIYREFALFSLREGLPELASYHARKWIAADPRAGTVVRALRTHWRALVAEPRAVVFLNRLFWSGPLRAHGLRPVAAPSA